MTKNMITKSFIVLFIVVVSIFGNKNEKSSWISIKFPGVGISNLNNPPIVSFSTDASGVLNQNIFKLTFTFGEEFCFAYMYPLTSLTELSVSYGYKWNFKHIDFNVCAGGGIAHGNFRIKYYPDADYISKTYDFSNKTDPIFKSTINLNYLTANDFSIGWFIEPFYIGPQMGCLTGLSINFRIFKSASMP